MGQMKPFLTFDRNNDHCSDPRCNREFAVDEERVWLADCNDVAYPFHPKCADQPWPMGLIEPEIVSLYGHH